MEDNNMGFNIPEEEGEFMEWYSTFSPLPSAQELDDMMLDTQKKQVKATPNDWLDTILYIRREIK